MFEHEYYSNFLIDSLVLEDEWNNHMKNVSFDSDFFSIVEWDDTIQKWNVEEIESYNMVYEHGQTNETFVKK